jgi:hypothetical protein
MRAAWMKERDDRVELQVRHCAETMKSMSTCDGFE